MSKIQRAAQYYVQQEVKGMIDHDISTGDMEEAFVAGVNWQVKQSPWISVDECLPLSDDDLYIALDTKMKPPGCGVCAFNPNTKKWTDSKGCIVLPTHWMPIPKLNQ